MTMMSRSIIILLTVVLFLSGCDRGAGVVKFEINAGKEITLNLDSDYKNGFRWRLAKPLSKEILAFKGSEYIEADRKETLVFKGLRPGKTTVFLEYGRDKESPAKKGRFAVIVH
jgi:predicted secreted protein